MRATISRAEICAICRMLGADPNDTKHIEVTPSAVTVTTYRNNEQGHRYVGEDGEVAMQVNTIPLVGDDGAEVVHMRHPDLPGQEITVRPRGVGQRAMAGWEVAPPQAAEPPPKDPPLESGTKTEAPAEPGASASPPPRGRRPAKKKESE